MSSSQNPADNQTNPKIRQRLASREQVPSVHDISDVRAEAQRAPGCSIELPWTTGEETFVLTASCDGTGKDPLWTLYQGEGANSQVVWTNVESDIELIYDVACMATSQAKPKPSAAAPTAELKAHIPWDMSLLEKQPNILLGHLLVESGLISGPNLEQALKLQEAVRDGKLNGADVIEAMRKTFPEVKGSTQAGKTPAPGKPGPKQTQRVVDLLKQAGLISEQDIQIAVLAWLQSEGNLGQILISTGKLDNHTFDAAATCVPLIEQDLMKPEQAVMTLNYCSRMRVSFDEALAEMGWENLIQAKPM